MNRRLLSTAILVFALSGAASCALPRPAPAPPAASAPAPVAVPEPVAAQSVPLEPMPAQQQPAPESVAEAAPAPGRLEGLPDIRLGADRPALTETLERALEMLTEQRARNEKLKETVASLERSLAAKDDAIEDLNRQLTESGTRVKEFETNIEKWKQDVLGFRDEMRASQEAEIEVLQQVVLLLREFKKESDAE